MVKKRNVFDINFDPDGDGAQQAAPETKSFRDVQGHPAQNEYVSAEELKATRRNPMASAISETAAASAQRAEAEAAILAENEALAHEHVRLKKLGLITDLIATAEVRISKLTRDRSQTADPDLEELKASIEAIGLSNPIRVEQTEDGYELIQGFRRLSAFRELERDTGDGRYARIPAALVPRGEPLVDLYRKMVDENMVRKDLSFAEMAQLALSYSRDENVDLRDAVRALYASALKQKRSYILSFATLLERVGDQLQFPESISRKFGLDLYKALEASENLGAMIAADLRDGKPSTPEAELQLLRGALERAKQAGRSAAPRGDGQRTVSKTSLRMTRPEGEARVIASDGKIELRLDRDFSAVSKADLQEAIEALLARLDHEP
ncbi:MAG: ParB/RepB/Spo0J family partition protein [Pseudomonadota bacterium]